jgi:hypothetical protein
VTGGHNLVTLKGFPRNGSPTASLPSENILNDYSNASDLCSSKSNVSITNIPCNKSENGSIFIKEVNNNIKLEFIFKKLCLLNIGYIHKLTEVPCKIHPGFKRIFIRLRWNIEPHTTDIRNQFMMGKTIKFVYDIPWFWVLCETPPVAKYLRN